MNIRRYILLALIFITGCSTTDEPESVEYKPSEIIAAVNRIHSEVGGNESGRFDAAAYFSVMKHIAPPKGYVLDYVTDDGPFLFWRKKEEPTYSNFREYLKELGEVEKLNEIREELPTRLELDGSPESFFEQTVFWELAGQFYLFWHSNYHNTQIVTSRQDIEDIIISLDQNDIASDLTEEQKNQARIIDTTIQFHFIDKDTAEVSVVLFGKWSGFNRVTHHISRKYPHVFIKTISDVLVEYNCGFIY